MAVVDGGRRTEADGGNDDDDDDDENLDEVGDESKVFTDGLVLGLQTH